MSLITKPMLAGKCEDVSKLIFPVLATPKLDGIRCLRIDGKALSRKFLAIPNDHIRSAIEREFTGYMAEFDGEIMIPNRSFNELSGDVRRHDGKPDFRYHVFDHVNASIEHGGLAAPYSARVNSLKVLSLPDFCVKVLPVLIRTVQELNAYEAECLLAGYEGVMVRATNSPYKCGRSTANEGYLLKVKRFEDGEAEVLGYECEYENQNVAQQDAFGRTKRSTNQENMVPKDRLGKLNVRDLVTKVEFDIGTGFTAKDREDLWRNKGKLKGLIAKYKHQPSGADEKPRFPVWLGWRDKWDMD
jgi:DNA ligase 1